MSTQKKHICATSRLRILSQSAAVVVIAIIVIIVIIVIIAIIAIIAIIVIIVIIRCSHFSR